MKKGDKIVIAVGVAVIVLAAIGLWIYAQEAGNEQQGQPQEKIKTYDVTWEEKKGSLSSVEGSASDKILGKDVDYNGTITIPVSNIKSITFTLTWEDDHTYGILKKKGEDTLTFSVVSPDGKEIGNEQSIGNGTIILTATNPESPQMVSYVEAKTLEDAERILESNYTCENWKNEPFELHVSVKVGEKFYRPLKRLMDTENNFTIDVTYTYYVPHLTEETTSSEETSVEETSSSTEMIAETDAIGQIIATGYGFH